MHTYEALKPEYAKYWSEMVVTRQSAALSEGKKILTGKEVYQDAVSGTDFPWFVVAIIHCREAGTPPDFKAVLHNGERIIGTGRKTRLVPPNRGPFNSFKESVKDALAIQNYGRIDWSDGEGPERLAWVLEPFNGYGYRDFHHVPSPYLWAATSIQKPGKYVSDRKWNPNVIDTQIGGMALLWALQKLDTSVVFPHAVAAGSAGATVGVSHESSPSSAPLSTSSDEPKATEDHSFDWIEGWIHKGLQAVGLEAKGKAIE